MGTPEKQSFETIELQHLNNTKPDGAEDVNSAEAGSDHGTAALGLALYAGSTVFNSGQSALAKLVGRHGVPVFEIVLTRSIFVFICAALPLLFSRISPVGKKPSFLLLRGFCSFCSVSALFWSVTLLPLADALILQFLSPLMTAVMAPLLIQEKPSRSVLVAIPVCIAAVVLIAQPSALFGGTEASGRRTTALGVSAGVFQAFAASANKIVTRYLKSENTNVSLLYLGAVGVLGSAVACVLLPAPVVLPRSAGLILQLIATAACAYLMQLCVTLGLKRVGATLGTALSYLTAVWGLALGYLIFHEVPSALSLVGAVMICVSALLLSVTEWLEARVADGSQPSLLAAGWHYICAGWHAVTLCCETILARGRTQEAQWQRMEDGQGQ